MITTLPDNRDRKRGRGKPPVMCKGFYPSTLTDSTRPTLKFLDLCCGEGGISVGAFQAAEAEGVRIEIYGVDHHEMTRYPWHFIQTNALTILRLAIETGEFDFIHASPPCKTHSQLAHFANQKSREEEITAEIRDMLRDQPTPYTIENVPSAPIRKDVILKGPQFGLPTIRNRIFEVGNWFMLNPIAVPHEGTQRGGQYLTVAGGGGYNKDWKPGHPSAINRPPDWTTGSPLEDKRIALGIAHMSDAGLSQAIPPEFYKYIFTEFLKTKWP